MVPALALLAGCYHYVPAEGMTYPQGTPVRAQLARLAAFELAQVTVNNVEQVEGEVVRSENGELVLSATWLETPTGSGFPGNGWTLRIPEREVARLQVRRLSWWRTGALLGGIALGTWLGFDALGFGTSGSGGGGGGGGPVQ
jgi:hypothetical protein